MSKTLFFILIMLLVLSNSERINNAVYGMSEISLNVVQSDIDKITNNITETRTTIKTTTKYDLITNEPSVKQEVISVTKIEYHIKTLTEVVDSIKINNNYPGLGSVIRNALLDTDINSLKNISAVNVMSNSEVKELCKVENDSTPERTLGCFDPKNFNIYVSELSTYSSLTCGTFENTLYHEIGHADYLSKNAYVSYLEVPYKERPPEIYAFEYADQHSKDKCSSDKYIELNNLLNASEKDEKLARSQLVYWDRYGQSIPEDVYYGYMRDYNAHIQAVNKYNSIVIELDEYMNNTLLTTRI